MKKEIILSEDIVDVFETSLDIFDNSANDLRNIILDTGDWEESYIVKEDDQCCVKTQLNKCKNILDEINKFLVSYGIISSKEDENRNNEKGYTLKF